MKIEAKSVQVIEAPGITWDEAGAIIGAIGVVVAAVCD